MAARPASQIYVCKIAPAAAGEAEGRPAGGGQSLLLRRILNEGVPTMSLAELQPYLRDKHRSAQSLVTVSRLARDLGPLREAAQRFPLDPQVQLELALRSEDAEEKSRAIKALSEVDSKNPMGPYLAASAAFAAGDQEEALRQMRQAAERGALEDYARTSPLSAEEACLAAGYQPLEAKAAGIDIYMQTATAAGEMELVTLSGQLSELSASLATGGDDDSALAVLDMGAALGRQMQAAPAQTGAGQLVGITLETKFLKKQAPDDVLPDQGITVQQRLDQLAERKNVIKAAMRGIDLSDPELNPAVLSQYLDRLKAEGELPAKQWLHATLGSPVASP